VGGTLGGVPGARAIAGLGAGHKHFAAHVFLVVQFGDGAPGLVDGEHFDEGKALGALGGAVDHDLGALDLADAAEEFGEVGFGHIVGQVADIQAAAGHLMLDHRAGRLGFARRARLPWFAGFARLAGFTRLAGFVASAITGLGRALAAGWAGGLFVRVGEAGAVGAAERRFGSESNGGEDFLPEGEFGASLGSLEGFRIAMEALAFMLVAAAVFGGALGVAVAVAAAAALARRG